MTFDLVITARDRKAEVIRFLSSLAVQDSHVSVRVLFADQGLNLSIADLVSGQASDLISLDTFRIQPCSLSSARNTAIDRGGLRSTFVAFPDDDCWYGPTVLRSVQAAFEAVPDMDCLCTHVFDPDRNLSYGHRPQGIHTRVDFSNIFYLPISVGIFVRREALERAGAYFDQNLGAGTALGSGEETELVARLLECGARIVYMGDISVFHPVLAYQQSDAKKFHAYGLGFGYLAVTFILRGHLSVAVQWCNIVGRSLLGFLASTFRQHQRDVYWQRFIGILKGSALGMRRKQLRKDA
jgi:hypothetical protein